MIIISNNFQLNDEKPEVVNLLSPYHMRTYGNFTVTFGDATIQQSSSVKNWVLNLISTLPWLHKLHLWCSALITISAT